MNTNPEGFPSEDERVASFMQALQRMHDDPAEAARIDLIVEEADAGLDAHEHGDGQPLVVHIHSEGRLNISALRQPVEPQPTTVEAEAPPEPRRPEPKKNRSLRLSATAATPLIPMTAVVLYSMQEGNTSKWLTAALSAVFMVTAAGLTLIRALTDHERRQALRRPVSRRARTRTRALNRQ
ncbi:hypothetical protein [Streptomyces sp. NPDC050504]|uniref:hypothetical protein n=1 Tax=Streptomyces sp. NPDC050504 TaxID=3365618 RepID=UPI00379B118C